MVPFYDRETVRIDNAKAVITSEGYLVADALVGRANNIQEYRAAELGLTDRAPHEIVRVFRPESEVFAVDSIETLSRLPITLDHPVKNGKKVLVDARNFTEFSRGETGEEVMRDGDFIRVPVRVTDENAVRSVRDDRQEFSLGYTAQLELVDGEFEGQAYDAVAMKFKYNHLAACRAARGGAELRITDERPAATGVKTMHNVLVDGVPVDASNPETAATVINNLVTARDTATQAAEAAQETITARDGTIAERDAEIVTLKDQLEKAKVSPADLRDAAAAFTKAQAQAKTLGVDVGDDLDTDAIKKTVVDAKLGDAAKDYTDAQYEAAFATLVANIDDADLNDAGPSNDPLRKAVQDSSNNVANISDQRQKMADAKAQRIARLNGSYKGKVVEPASA